MITNAKRLIEIKNVRKAFNNIDFEVPRDHTSRALTLTVSKKGVVLCKKSECLHFNMFGVCGHSIAVAEFTNNLNASLSNYVEKSKRGKLIEMIRYGHPSGSRTKKGFKKKRISKSSKVIHQGQGTKTKEVSLPLEEDNSGDKAIVKSGT